MVETIEPGSVCIEDLIKTRVPANFQRDYINLPDSLVGNLDEFRNLAARTESDYLLDTFKTIMSRRPVELYKGFDQLAGEMATCIINQLEESIKEALTTHDYTNVIKRYEAMGQLHKYVTDYVPDYEWKSIHSNYLGLF